LIHEVIVHYQSVLVSVQFELPRLNDVEYGKGVFFEGAPCDPFLLKYSDKGWLSCRYVKKAPHVPPVFNIPSHLAVPHLEWFIATLKKFPCISTVRDVYERWRKMGFRVAERDIVRMSEDDWIRHRHGWSE